MRRGGYTIAVTAGVALLLAIWVTSTDAIHLLRGGPRPDHDGVLPILRSQHHQRRPHRGLTPLPVDPTLNHIMNVTEWVVLSLCTVALVAFLAMIMVKGRDRRRARLAAAGRIDEDSAVDALLLPSQVVETARRQLLLLREGSPRNAIVACWMELERACTDSGFPRHPAETSSEFTARVLGQFVLDPTAVEGLARLYREARFSEHALQEPHRSQAIADLEQVLTALEHTHARQAQRAGLVSAT